MRNFSAIAFYVLLTVSVVWPLPGFSAKSPPQEAGKSQVIESVNSSGFTFVAQYLPFNPTRPGTIFLLSNCPGEGCVALTGSYMVFFIETGVAGDLMVSGTECRPRIAFIEDKMRMTDDFTITIPANDACADLPRSLAGRYNRICGWRAKDGDLSLTGWHQYYECFTRPGKSFPLYGPP